MKFFFRIFNLKLQHVTSVDSNQEFGIPFQGKSEEIYSQGAYIPLLRFLHHRSPVCCQYKREDKVNLAHYRLNWARASRDSKFYKIESALADIREFKNRIEEKKAEINLLQQEQTRAQETVDSARKIYREQLLSVEDINNQMDPRYLDALSSDVEPIQSSNSSDSEELDKNHD